MSEQNEKRPFLEVKNLVVEYRTGGEVVHAVNDVSFTLEKGKVLGLVGETGAGKTSIARAILRILPDPPAKVPQGEIFLEGENLLSIPEERMQKVRGKRISMIFQDPMTAMNPVISVGDQIAESIILHEDVSKEGAQKKAEEMLEMVGIPKTRYREYPHQFSGGMKQRGVIAMALACNPELLLADEPTTALDVTIQAQVLDMMKKLRDELDTAMILITHDLGVVADVADHVAVVYAGEIIEYGSKEQLYLNPKHPYTIGLFGTIPTIDGDETRLKVIPGMPPNPADLPQGCHFHPRCQYATEACKQGNIESVEVEPGHFCKCCNLNNMEVK